MEEFVRISALDTVTEAQLLETALKERNIPYAIRPNRDSALGPLTPPDKGWGCVAAPMIYQKMIMYIISDLRKDGGRHESVPQKPAS